MPHGEAKKKKKTILVAQDASKSDNIQPSCGCRVAIFRTASLTGINASMILNVYHCLHQGYLTWKMTMESICSSFK